MMARQVAAQWLSGTEFDIAAIQVAGNSIALTVRGPGESPPFERLVTSLDNAVGRKLTVELVIVPAEKRFHRELTIDVANP